MLYTYIVLVIMFYNYFIVYTYCIHYFHVSRDKLSKIQYDIFLDNCHVCLDQFKYSLHI